MKNFRGVQLIDKAMATKAILEERRLAMLEDFQVHHSPCHIPYMCIMFATEDEWCTRIHDNTGACIRENVHMPNVDCAEKVGRYCRLAGCVGLGASGLGSSSGGEFPKPAEWIIQP
jgi:hypothetical protein